MSRSLRAMPVELQRTGYGARIGTLGPIVVSVFEGAPELPMLDDLQAVQEAQIAKHGRVSSMSIIAMPRLDPPAAAFRERAARLSEKFRPAIVGTAIVILSTGAAAVVARGFLAAYALLVRPDTAQKTFRELAPAVEWLQALPEQPAEVKESKTLTADVTAFTFPQKPPQP